MRLSGRTGLAAFTALVYLFLFGPLVVTVLFAFSDSQFPTFPITGWSLKWFEALWNSAAVMRALTFSLVLGAAVTLAALAIGIPAALALARYDFPGKAAVGFLMLSPVLIPETVLAVGLLLLMRWVGQPRTLGTLFLGHVVIASPFVVLVAQARLAGVQAVYEEAARSLGANRWQTFREITFPLMLPAVLAGGLLAFVISFDNITATMFWRPGGVETVPTLIYAMLRDSISPEINALGTVVVALTVATPLIAGQVVRRVARARKIKHGDVG